jgi:hypothetical protein
MAVDAQTKAVTIASAIRRPFRFTPVRIPNNPHAAACAGSLQRQPVKQRLRVRNGTFGFELQALNFSLEPSDIKLGQRYGRKKTKACRC